MIRNFWERFRDLKKVEKRIDEKFCRKKRWLIVGYADSLLDTKNGGVSDKLFLKPIQPNCLNLSMHMFTFIATKFDHIHIKGSIFKFI